MRLMRILVAMALCAGGLAATPARAAGGGYGFDAGQGMIATFSSGGYRGIVFGLEANAANDYDVTTPDPQQYSQDVVCVELSRLVKQTFYGYGWSHTVSYYAPVDWGCGRVSVTTDQQQTTGRIKGTMRGQYRRTTITLDVTFTEAGSFMPYFSTGRTEDVAFTPTAAQPANGPRLTIRSIAGGGLTKPANAKGTILSNKYGIKAKSGKGSLFTSVGGSVHLYN